MAKWHKALALPRAERALLIEAARRLLQAWVMLRFLPFKRVVATLGDNRKRSGTPDIRQVRWSVETAARNLPLPLTCLPQAFAASWMLLARGGTPRLHYGVAKTQTGFQAHAWVELDGKPVIGHHVANRFTLLATFPAPQAASR
jgi:hypothetical protein